MGGISAIRVMTGVVVCYALLCSMAVHPRKAGSSIRTEANAEAPANVYRSDPSAGVPIEVTLGNLYGAGTTLNGRYARVSSQRLDPPGEATPGLGGRADFRFDPGEPEAENCSNELGECTPFDAANVYYHIDRMATEFWRDRMGVDPPFQADVVIHAAGDGAGADPDNNRITLTTGDIFLHNAAKEDEFIYHEYTHLVAASLGFSAPPGTSEQARALLEGYADYFAATFTGDPLIGDWVVTCPDRQGCPGPPDDTDMRTLASDPLVWNWEGGNPDPGLKYGICTRFHEGEGRCKTSWNNNVPPYTWSMIWSGLLWDIRSVLGADTTDRLALHAMSRAEVPTETFESAVVRLLEADGELFHGANVVSITGLAEERGITPARPTWVSPESPPLAFGLRAYPTPGARQVRVVADLPVSGQVAVRAFDARGRLVEQVFLGFRSVGPNEWTWSSGNLLPGAYFIRVDLEGGGTQVAPVVVPR